MSSLSQRIEPIKEAIDKAIQYADRIVQDSIALEQSILYDITAASSELEEASSHLARIFYSILPREFYPRTLNSLFLN